MASLRLLEIAIGLVDHLGTAVESLRDRFSHLLAPELLNLLLTAETLEDRFALALRLIPANVAMRLACDFAENALDSTADQCSTPLEVGQHRRYVESVQTLRQCLAGERNDASVVYSSWPAYGEFSVCRPIAEAGEDPDHAASHCWRSAKWARQYYSSRITHYSMSERTRRKVESYELRWQMEHAKVVLVKMYRERALALVLNPRMRRPAIIRLATRI